MSDCNDAFSLAIQGGKHLINQVTQTTLGLRFPEISEQGEKEYGFQLYQGASGVGIALLDLFRATGDEAYSSLIQKTSYDLIESTPNRPHLHSGLYAGHSGVALFQLYTAQVLQDPIALKEAYRLADQLTETPFYGTDLISGATGTGIFFLSFYYATQEERYLSAAQRAVYYLKETAEKDRDALFWAPLVPGWGKDNERYIPYTGLSHGVAGICLFLIEMANITQDDLPTHLFQGGLKWLDKKMLSFGEGINWPVSVMDPKLRYHWCHGSTGIGQTYLALYRKTGDTKALRIAVDAGRTTLYLLNHQINEAPYHCHGLAGIIEFFLDLEANGAGEEWGRIAADMMPNFLHKIKQGEDASDLGTPGTSLATGTAGIIRVLLRLAGKPNLPIFLPFREPLNFSIPDKSEEVVLSKFKPEKSVKSEAIKKSNLLGENDARELLPRLTTKLPDKDLWVFLDPSDNGLDAQFFKDFTEHPASQRFFEAFGKVKNTSANLENRYKEILSPGVLNHTLHGHLLREISGICLQNSNNGGDISWVINKLTNQYTSMLELLFSRLSTDVHGLLSSEVDGRLRKIEILNSDPHRNGQRVIALSFEDGKELIYKSRSNAIERYLIGASHPGEPPSLAEVVNGWLNPAIPGAGLPTHRIIQGGSHYGYAERIKTRLEPIDYITVEKIERHRHGVPPIPIRAIKLKESEENRFWYSAGLLAGYAVGLGLCDLHSENLVCGKSASSKELAFHSVDLELAFHEIDCLRDTILVDLTHIEQPDLYAKGVHKHVGFDQEKRLCGSPREAWLFDPTSNGLKLIPGWHAIGDLDFCHLVQNHDGSLGYRNNLCWLLRGLIDLWETLREHAEEVTLYLKEHLWGAPARVIVKATQQYFPCMRRYRAGAYPLAGGSWNFLYSEAMYLTEEELRQLQSCDIPYFFQYLGQTEGPLSGVRWFDNCAEGDGRVGNIENTYLGQKPFCSIVERQTKLEVLARCLADAAAFVAPEGTFDYRNDSLGVRVFRPEDDSRIWFVVLLSDCRLTCRIEGEGGVSMWVD